MSPLIDMTGKKIGRLTVICREGTYQRPSGNKEPTWRCVCECGNEVVVHASNLKKRNTLSCGCLQGESRKEPRRETEYEVRGEVAYVKAFDGAEVVVNSCDLDYVLSHRWHLNGHGYAVDEHGITMHRALMFPPDCMDIHHINGNKLDNRRSNLLMLTRSEHTALHNGKDLLANGVTVQQWIPVTERLPDSETIVLASAKSKTFGVRHTLMVSHVGHHEATTEDYGWRECECDTEYDEERDCFWIPECWWEVNSVEDNGNYIIDNDYVVTHWMPLPEPPKEGE